MDGRRGGEEGDRDGEWGGGVKRTGWLRIAGGRPGRAGSSASGEADVNKRQRIKRQVASKRIFMK